MKFIAYIYILLYLSENSQSLNCHSFIKIYMHIVHFHEEIISGGKDIENIGYINIFSRMHCRCEQCTYEF